MTPIKKEDSSIAEEGAKQTISKKKAAPKRKKTKIPVRNLTTKKKTVEPEFKIEEYAEPEIETMLAEKRQKRLAKEVAKKSSKPDKEVLYKVPPIIKKTNIYRKIALAFVLLTVVLLLAIFYFSYRKATIILISNTERLADSLNFEVYNQDKNSDIQEAGNKVFGLVEKSEVAKEKNYETSGKEKIGEEVIGQVTIINNYSKNQPLVASTRLISADGKLFRLKKTVNAPAGGKVEAEVYADKPDSSMAIGPTRFTIPGLWAGLQDKIYAESKIKFVYQEQTKRRIEQSDIDRGTADLKADLLADAERKFGDTYKGFSGVVYQLDESTITTKIDGKVGDEKANFTVSMKADALIVAFSKEKIEKTAKDKLSLVIPGSKELIGFDNKAISYFLNNYDLAKGYASVTANFEGMMSLKKDADIIDRRKILGLTESQLISYLKNFNEFSSYEIHFTPNFIRQVPKLIDRVEIDVK
jgi:hypothetical protein